MLKKSIDFLIFSKIYVAIPVASLSLVSFFVFQKNINWNIVAFTYFSTLFLYAFHLFWGLKFINLSTAKQRHLWAVKNKNTLATIAGTSLCLAAYFLIQLSSFIWVVILPIALISIGYTLPVLITKRLRDLPFIKIYLISVVVAGVVVVLPGLESTINKGVIMELFVVQLLFLFGITIPFDIRDMEIDKTELKTIPMAFGEKKAKKIAILALCVSAALALKTTPISIGIAFGVTALIAAILVWISSSQKSEYYFSLLVEGTMLVQCALVYFLR